MLLDSAITTRNRVPTRSRQALVRIDRRILEACWCHPTDYRTFRLYTGVFIGAPTTGPREPCYRGLFEAGGNQRYAELLVRTADRFKATAPSGMSTLLDPDFRVEDMFFASALLGRATGITGDSSYVDVAASFLLEASEKLLQDNGLYWHSLTSPFFWGRGNGFAALGFAELLTYPPAEHAARPARLHRGRLLLGLSVRGLDTHSGSLARRHPQPY